MTESGFAPKEIWLVAIMTRKGSSEMMTAQKDQFYMLRWIRQFKSRLSKLSFRGFHARETDREMGEGVKELFMLFLAAKADAASSVSICYLFIYLICYLCEGEFR